MNTYRILLQQNPQSLDVPEFCQPGFIFNEVDHLQQQDGGQFYLLTALNQTTQRTEARCAFFIRANEIVSPIAAPFGSIEFSETLPESVLDEFLNSFVDIAHSANAATLRLVNYPNCYAPKQVDRLTTSLIKHDFQVSEANQNFFLSITDLPFDQTIAPSEQRRLRKCREAGFEFAHWEAPNLSEAIEFLQATRQQKGYSFSLPPEKLASLVHKFPNQFSVFTVRDGSKLIAITITVRVRHDILYNFLPASHPDYQTFSPMVMLIEGLFVYCQQQKIWLLDLGVSLDHNRQPKPGLMRFKRNLGAQESPKLVFEKMF